MLKLMIGVKGTGKTKALIEKANTASRESHGDVVCVEKGTVLRFDLAPKIRLIDTDEYKIHNAQALYGFIAGILASNYDVTDLFLDNTLRKKPAKISRNIFEHKKRGCQLTSSFFLFLSFGISFR